MRTAGRLLYFVLIGLLTAFLSVSATTRVLTLQEAADDPLIDVRLISKSGGGYLGDKVSITVRNRTRGDIQVTARVGDILVNRSSPKQNLVVTKMLVLRVPAGQERSAAGIWTACIDHSLGSPGEGDTYDLAPNLVRWRVRSAQDLLDYLNSLDPEESVSQGRVWNHTDSDDFPALSRDDSTSPLAGYVVPPELHPVVANPGIPDSPLGTGDVRVTLTWQSTADLDLWVTDPYEERIFWGYRESSSGGLLDADDRCTDHGFDGIPGGPENIYWPYGSAPYGTYIVEVNYYAACSGEGTTEWEVRVIRDGHEEVLTGVISPDQTILVTIFER